MNEKPEIEVGKLPVITKFIYTLGVLPTSYLMSMTYQEQVTWLYNYLQTQVIPLLNTESAAIQELQTLYELLRTYVNDYFDNLDVQEEINQKLEEMSESGELTQLIKAYVDPIYEAYEEEINEDISSFKNQTNISINDLRNEVESIASGSPIPVSSTSYMTDTTKVYLLLTDGYIYYYNGNNWVQGWPYQSYVDSSLAIKTNIELLKTQGAKIFDDFKYGSVTQSLTPLYTHQTDFKYIILDKDLVDDFMYIYTTESNNVLMKRSYYRADNTRITYDQSWVEVNEKESIFNLTNTVLADVKYIAITLVYSTDLTAENRINDISLDNLFISNLKNTNVEEFSNIKEKTNIMLNDYTGYKLFNNFKYGSITKSTFQIENYNTKKYKYIIINASDLNSDLYLKNEKVNHNTFVYICLYNGNDRVFQSGAYTKLDNNEIVFRNSWKNTYTFDKLVLSICYSDENNYDSTTIIDNISLNDLYISEKTNNIEQRLNLLNIEYDYDAIVDINGLYGYSSINKAITNTLDGDTILILPGTYNEDVRLWGKNRKLIGTDRDSCIIYSGSGLYETPALEVNKGEIKNLTIISGNDDELSEDSEVNKSYGIHIEYSDNNDFSLLIENCHVISYLNNAIGIGCRYNQTITIKDCLLESLATKFWSSIHEDYFACGGLLFHNDANYSGDPSVSNGKLNVINCEIRGKNTAIMAHSMQNGNKMTVKFIGNLAYKENQNLSNVINFWPSGTKGNQPYLIGTDIILDNLSCNNNSDEIDFKNYWN